MQQTSPSLHKELTALKDERMDNNISSEQQKTIETANADLEAKLRKMEAENAALEKEKAELRKHKTAVEKELKKTTDTMKKFIEKARE